MVDRAVLEQAVSDGIAEANTEMREANPVLEDLIEGLEIIKAQAGLSGIFNYSVQPLLDGPTLLETTLHQGGANRPITISVEDDGRIGYWGNGSQVPVNAPWGADAATTLAYIAKQARLERQIVPVPPPPEPPAPPPPPALPAADVPDAVKEMRTQINQNAARNRAGQRSPGQ